MEHDQRITSDELDGLLGEADTLSAARASSVTEVRLYVSVDSETLQEFEQRAAAEGTDLNAASAHALRAGTRAA